MSSWALLGGLMGGAQAAQTLLLDRARQMEKDKDKADEEALWEKRQRIMESLKAPAEKVEEIDDPDKPGWKLKVTKQWNPPQQDGQKGTYVEVGRAAVPPSLKKDKISLAGNKEQDILYDDAGNIKPLGAPRDIFDPEGAKRTQLEAGRLGMEGQRLNFDKDKFAQEQKDKNDPAKRAALMPFEPIVEEDATTGQKTHMRFDRRTGTMGAPPTYHAPGISDIQATGDSSPLSQLSGNTGGAGSGGSMAPTPAKGAAGKNAHGTIIKTGTNAQGQRVAQYSDGTILPI